MISNVIIYHHILSLNTLWVVYLGFVKSLSIIGVSSDNVHEDFGLEFVQLHDGWMILGWRVLVAGQKARRMTHKISQVRQKQQGNEGMNSPRIIV